MIESESKRDFSLGINLPGEPGIAQSFPGHLPLGAGGAAAARRAGGGGGGEGVGGSPQPRSSLLRREPRAAELPPGKDRPAAPSTGRGVRGERRAARGAGETALSPSPQGNCPHLPITSDPPHSRSWSEALPGSLPLSPRPEAAPAPPSREGLIYFSSSEFAPGTAPLPLRLLLTQPLQSLKVL